MHKIMILLNNFSSETTWPIFTKFHVDPMVEMGLSLFKWSRSIDCLVRIWLKNNNKNTFFFFKTKNFSNDDPFISCDDRIGKMLHNI